LCGIRNGSKEYAIQGFVWPEGFRHYVSSHHVAVPAPFYAAVVEGRINDQLQGRIQRNETLNAWNEVRALCEAQGKTGKAIDAFVQNNWSRGPEDALKILQAKKKPPIGKSVGRGWGVKSRGDNVKHNPASKRGCPKKKRHGDVKALHQADNFSWLTYGKDLDASHMRTHLSRKIRWNRISAVVMCRWLCQQGRASQREGSRDCSSCDGTLGAEGERTIFFLRQILSLPEHLFRRALSFV